MAAPSLPVMEKIAAGKSTGRPARALLSLATGVGKTFIAVNLLKRLSDAGQLTRALFVCDRDELRTQALKAFQNVFGSDAAEACRNSDGTNNAKNARVHIATYQTLGIDSDADDASFLTTFYPENHFSHIVIDECHRSAWGKWSQVLTRNASAVQVGLTATPRELTESLKRHPDAPEAVADETLPPPPPDPAFSVEGFDVHVTDAGRFIVADVDGQAVPVPVEEYKARLAARLVSEVSTLDDFRKRWIDPPAREELVAAIITSGFSPAVVRMIDGKVDYDLYDVLAELGWGMSPRTRRDRALAFAYKHEEWINALPPEAAATIRAVASQFERGGTDGLENPQIFATPEVRSAGGLASLKLAGNPRDLLTETKTRMFAA